MPDRHDDGISLARQVQQEVLAGQVGPGTRQSGGVGHDVVGEEIRQHGKPARGDDLKSHCAWTRLRLDEYLAQLQLVADGDGTAFGHLEGGIHGHAAWGVFDDPDRRERSSQSLA